MCDSVAATRRGTPHTRYLHRVCISAMYAGARARACERLIHERVSRRRPEFSPLPVRKRESAHARWWWMVVDRSRIRGRCACRWKKSTRWGRRTQHCPDHYVLDTPRRILDSLLLLVRYTLPILPSENRTNPASSPYGDPTLASLALDAPRPTAYSSFDLRKYMLFLILGVHCVAKEFLWNL